MFFFTGISRPYYIYISYFTKHMEPWTAGQLDSWTAANLFEKLSSGGVNVDLIIQATHEGKSNDIAFTIAEKEIEKAFKIY